MIYISAQLRRQVIERGGNCCEYCLLPQSAFAISFHMEHIRSIKHGGTSDVENLALSCPTCNEYKGTDIASFDNRTESYAGFFNPRIHDWDAHFLLEGIFILPRTPEGRTTEYIFKLNERERLNRRRLLVRLSRYPCVKRTN